MFTVKHVGTNGSESIVSVNLVSFDKGANCLVGYGPNGMEFVRWDAGSAFVMNEQGKTVGVFVMNEQGKTVGVYNLSIELGTIDVTTEQAEQARRAAEQSTKQQA